jgi:glycosyltransferase involved in cell wall biosynthesis
MLWFSCLLVAYLFFLLFLLIGYRYGVAKRKKDRKKDISIELNDVTVVIPFRNEKENLNVLINQIKRLKIRPLQFLFVDDHSTDGGAALIEANRDNAIALLSMKEKTGKKEAVYKGVIKAKTSYILCWDADISFSIDYFKELRTKPKKDLVILPVHHMSLGIYDWFFEIDVILANYINHSSYGVNRPVICSGANLLFKKASYLEVIALESHKHIASGDDAFLLRNMQQANKSIELGALNHSAVSTPNPGNFIEFLSQRARWFGKTFLLKDKLLNAYGLIQLLFALGFFALLLFLICTDPILLLKFWFVKSLIETVFLLPFFYALNKTKLLTILPLYGVVFPIYNIILLSSLFRKKKWKGRVI